MRSKGPGKGRGKERKEGWHIYIGNIGKGRLEEGEGEERVEEGKIEERGWQEKVYGEEGGKGEILTSTKLRILLWIRYCIEHAVSQ